MLGGAHGTRPTWWTFHRETFARDGNIARAPALACRAPLGRERPSFPRGTVADLPEHGATPRFHGLARRLPSDNSANPRAVLLRRRRNASVVFRNRGACQQSRTHDFH